VRLAALGNLVIAALVLAACGGHRAASPSTIVVTSTTTVTRITSAPPASTTYRPAPAMTVPPAPPDAPLPAGYRDAECPYLDRQTAQDLEGNRISRVAVGPAHPVSCRFYFWCCDYHATLDIAPTIFPNADAAYNAMVRTGQSGGNVQPAADLAPGVDGVLYQSLFYGPDGAKDWACAFAAGRTMVVVRTDQSTVSLDARRVAQEIARRF
jgi:hypothetical protein